MSNPKILNGGRYAPRSTPLQILAAAERAGTKILSRHSVGVDDADLVSGYRKLRENHSELLDCLILWPDQQAAIKALRTYRFFCSARSYRCAHSRWEFASRVSPRAFLTLYFKSTHSFTHALCMLPDPMLIRAARLVDEGINLCDAFIGHTPSGGGQTQWLPKASMFFPGLAPALDVRLIENHLETNVEFLSKLAACTAGDEQFGFLDHWLGPQGPAFAEAWLALPAWKRPLLHGPCRYNRLEECQTDPEAHEIWESFDFLRGTLMGVHLPNDRDPITVGHFFQHYAKKTFHSRPRWNHVYWRFGACLFNGDDPGDMKSPPWPRLWSAVRNPSVENSTLGHSVRTTSSRQGDATTSPS